MKVTAIGFDKSFYIFSNITMNTFNNSIYFSIQMIPLNNYSVQLIYAPFLYKYAVIRYLGSTNAHRLFKCTLTRCWFNTGSTYTQRFITLGNFGCVLLLLLLNSSCVFSKTSKFYFIVWPIISNLLVRIHS